jgi:putative secretion ATPase (PEP-CTERM system associated)
VVEKMLNLYETYYKLSADPFRLSPDHRFAFGHRSYARAKAYLEYALHRGEGFITITGSAGTGKTTLISEILADLDKSRLKVATLNSTQLEGKDLLQMVAALFDLEYEDESKASLLLEIQQFLKQLSQKGRRAVLIVDEAQGLSPSAVEELRLLANLQLNHRLLLQVFLVGQEQLRDMVQAPGMEHLRQRIVAASHLEVLKLDETISYVEHRLTRVGWQGDPALTEDALRLVHKFSAGVPRRINLICSRLFLYGSMEHKHQLDGEDARSVIEDLQRERLISPEAVEAQADPEQGIEQDEGAEAPVRRLPRTKPSTRPQQASSAATNGQPGESPSGDTGPGSGTTDARAGASAEQTDAEAELALRERDIWGEIEHLEKELRGAAEEMHSAEELHAVDVDTAVPVAAPGVLARKGAAQILQQDAVGAAVSKAVARGRATRTSGQRASEQPRVAAARVRQARPRVQSVPEPIADATVENEEIRPLPRAERREAMRRSRPQVVQAAPLKGKRRWTLIIAVLTLGLGLAGVLGWQNRDRLSSSQPDTTGTIQRDTAATQPSETETGPAAVPVEVPGSEPVPDSGGETPAGSEAAAGGLLAELPELDTDAETRSNAPSGPDHTPAVESGLPAPVGSTQDSAAAAVVKALRSREDAADVTREADAGLATPAQTPAPDAAAPAVAEETTQAARGLALAATERAGGTSEQVDSIEAERARLRREAEQRFQRQLNQVETVPPTERFPTPPSAREAADTRPRPQTAATSPVAPRSERSETKKAVDSVRAPAAPVNPAPASRPKIASVPKPVASAAADIVAEPVRSPEQLRKNLLQAQWVSQGKPATLLPSEITFCSAAGTAINCWSVPQQTDTKYGKAVYKVEANLDGFEADGGFRLSYRTLVKLLGSEAAADEAALRNAADDDAGWQVTERSMECELGPADSVQCRGANGTVRDYRKSSAGN